MMFPYPSAEGLHVGNLFAFTGNDIYGRFQRLMGHNVFEPLGYDAFGIHSENYALKVGLHPMDLIPRNIANFQRQLERAGLMVDWRYTLSTTEPNYYKWTQWLFLQLFEQGLAYKKQAAVNWCPKDKTVLANEQVVGGHCERCGTPVEQRLLEQWFFRISDYAPRLLENLDHIDWSETTKTAQRNWIGRSEGAELAFATHEVEGGECEIRVFTTRPDTIYGATYMVLAPEHPLVKSLTKPKEKKKVEAYREKTKKQDIITRKTSTEKTGVFTGSYAINPATEKEIPIWVSDYVLMEYGTGAIMGVPGHDQRDFEFATKFELPIVRVVCGEREDASTPLHEAFVECESGTLVNSGVFDGFGVEAAKKAIVEFLAKGGSAKPVVHYRLHDWCISRQRYWGPPIPIIYCESCGTVPVPEKDLPVMLPFIDDFRPDDSGKSPLARHEEWYRVECPKCGKPGRRETDVSDNFLDNSWYFLRYPSVGRDDVPFEKKVTKKWLPVDSYIGGNEHAVLHLLYSRFITMVLHDAGHLEFEEPFTRFRAHGTHHPRRREDVEDAGQHRQPRRVHRGVGRGCVSHLSHVPRSVRAGRRLPRSEHLGNPSLSGQAVRIGAEHVGRRRARSFSDAEAASDDPESRRRHSASQLQHGDRGDDGVHERAAERRAHAASRRSSAAHHARRAIRAAHRRGAVGADGRNGKRVRLGVAALRSSLAAEDSIELVVQVNGKVRSKITVPRDIAEEAAVVAALADPTVAKFVSGTPKKIIFVPGRLLNIVA